MVEAVSGIVIASFIVLFAAGIVLSVQLDQRLREKHPAVWGGQGRPSIWNHSIRSDVLGIWFVWSSQHRRLDDATLERIARRLRIVHVLYAVSFLLVIMLVVRRAG